jgi:uncharacterized protein (DUF1778 family)
MRDRLNKTVATLFGLKPETVVLSAEDYDAFVRQLDDPPKPNEKLVELLRCRPIWDR